LEYWNWGDWIHSALANLSHSSMDITEVKFSLGK
jgi:hypothetical protein